MSPSHPARRTWSRSSAQPRLLCYPTRPRPGCKRPARRTWSRSSAQPRLLCYPTRPRPGCKRPCADMFLSGCVPDLEAQAKVRRDLELLAHERRCVAHPPARARARTYSEVRPARSGTALHVPPIVLSSSLNWLCTYHSAMLDLPTLLCPTRRTHPMQPTRVSGPARSSPACPRRLPPSLVLTHRQGRA